MRLDTLIKVVVGIEHLELGAAVYLVGCRLVLVAEPVDELLVEYVTLLELGVLFCNVFCHRLGHGLAIALGLEAVTRYTMGNQVIDHALGASIAQPVIVVVTANAVGVRCHLNGDVGVVLHHLHHLVEGLLTLVAQRSLVVIVENLLDDLRLEHRCQDEVYIILGIGLLGVALELLLAIQVALGASQHHIVHTALQVKPERAIGLSSGLLVAAVIAHDAYDGIGHRLIVLVEHITADPHLLKIWS